MTKIVDSENLGPAGNGKAREFLFGHEKWERTISALIVVGLIALVVARCSV